MRYDREVRRSRDVLPSAVKTAALQRLTDEVAAHISYLRDIPYSTLILYLSTFQNNGHPENSPEVFRLFTGSVLREGSYEHFTSPSGSVRSC